MMARFTKLFNPKLLYAAVAIVVFFTILMQLMKMKLFTKATPFLEGSKPIMHAQEFAMTRKLHDEEGGGLYNVMFQFNNVKGQQHLQVNFRHCISSMLAHASRIPIVHVVGDMSSFQIVKKILHDLGFSERVKVVHHDQSEIQTSIFQTVSAIHQQLSRKNHHFSDPLFYLSIVMHRVMPLNVSRIILFDVDIVFKSDIASLFSLFDKFSGDQVIGIARENQPVYRHVFWEYRKKHPGTRIGEPPPFGLIGFNSGVVMLDLNKLRTSVKYNSFLAEDALMGLVNKYEFQGHLGDQDFFSLLSFEYESIFYILPCGWNRQLCTWWRRDVLAPVFDDYYKCDGPVHIWHGNCKTSLDNYTSHHR